MIPGMTRRSWLKGGGGIAAGLLAPLPLNASPGRRAPLDLTSPRDALIASRKCAGTLEDNVEIFSWMDGTVFALFDDGRRREALHGVTGLFPSRSWRQPDGSFKIASWNAIFYTDLATGKVIEEFRNPYTGELCKVHNHASILNTVAREGLGKRTTPTISMDSQWITAAGSAIEVTNSSIRKKNPISPDKWKRESDGEWYEKSMASHTSARLEDLENPDLPSVDAVVVVTRFGPWYPWMLMGGKPGRNFSQMVLQKSSRLSGLPRNILDYAEKRHPDALSAPRTWTGEYMDPETLYTLERTPA